MVLLPSQDSSCADRERMGRGVSSAKARKIVLSSGTRPLPYSRESRTGPTVAAQSSRAPQSAVEDCVRGA